MTDDALQQTIDGLPGPDDWRAFCRQVIDAVRERQRKAGVKFIFLAPPIARYCAKMIPQAYVGDALYHGIAPYIRQLLKSERFMGMMIVGVPAAATEAIWDGINGHIDDDERSDVVYQAVDQLSLAELLAWKFSQEAGHDRINRKVEAVCAAWREANPACQFSVAELVALDGVPVPA